MSPILYLSARGENKYPGSVTTDYQLGSTKADSGGTKKMAKQLLVAEEVQIYLVERSCSLLLPVRPCIVGFRHLITYRYAETRGEIA